MKYAGISLELIALLIVGFIIKWSYKDKIQNNTLKTLITSFFLPILLFMSFSEVEYGKLNILPFLFFGIGIGILYQIIFMLLLKLKCPYPKDQKILVITTLASISPGLSVYPFADRFLGRYSLSGLAMMNLGIKFYIFTYLYFQISQFVKKTYLAKNNNKAPVSTSSKWKTVPLSVIRFFVEPVIFATLAGLIFYLTDTPLTILSPISAEFLNMIGDACTLLIMIFIGFNLYHKFDLSKLICDLSVLCIRSGFGFMISAWYCYFLHIRGDDFLLYVVITQGAVALWPYIITDIVSTKYRMKPPGEDLSLRLISTSFPLTIIIMLILFNIGNRFKTLVTYPLIINLTIAGAIISIIGILIYLMQKKQVSIPHETHG